MYKDISTGGNARNLYQPLHRFSRRLFVKITRKLALRQRRIPSVVVPFCPSPEAGTVARFRIAVADPAHQGGPFLGGVVGMGSGHRDGAVRMLARH